MSAVIVGSGFAGIAAAIELRAAGIRDVTILERANGLGGVWRENTYPGAGCDVPAPYYSLSYAMNPYSTNRYTMQPEILEYLHRVTDSYELWRSIVFNTEAATADFHQRSGEWVVTATDGRQFRARMFVPAIGQLSRPALPNIPGMDAFRGPSFHSARWRHDISLRDKRIAVIGTGASAIQFVPRIQPLARAMTVFQRSAPHILPKPDTCYGRLRGRIFHAFPETLGVERAWFWGLGELATQGILGSKVVAGAFQTIVDRFRAKYVPDPRLRAQLTPDYPIGCKRVLFSNDYYPALTAANTKLETTSIERITGEGVRTADGIEHPAEVLIYGTGFAATDFHTELHVTGKDGVHLEDVWRGGAHAYLGMTVPGFPNMFCMYGPNTNLGSGSVLYMLERQARYLSRAAVVLARNPSIDLDVRSEVEHRYDEEIQQRLTGSAWTSCTSWYRQADGRIPTNWPGTVSEYHRRTRKFELGDYRILEHT